jgi:hypothetical protein
MAKRHELDNAFQQRNRGRSEENYSYVLKNKKQYEEEWLNDLWKDGKKFLSEDGYWYVRMTDVCEKYGQTKKDK